jgi:hypothetical protein
MYGMHTNEEIEQIVDMYIFYDVSLLPNPLQNAQQHQHTCTCKKKPCILISLFITSYAWNKKLKPFQINGNYPFSQQYFQTQANKIFQYLNYLNLDENTYILSLRSKLTKSHIFLKRIFKNIKTYAFNINDAHLWFTNTNIQFILNPYAIATYWTSYMTYDKNK